MIYELTNQQVKNLLVFLERTTLKGSENIALNEIIIAFSKPIKEEEKKDEPGNTTGIEGAGPQSDN